MKLEIRYNGSEYMDNKCVEQKHIVKYCCFDMHDAFNDHTIEFGEKESMGLNVNRHVNIFKCLPYYEGAVWEATPIKFCPFCAEKIEIVLVDN